MAIPRSSAGKLPQTTTIYPSPEPKEDSMCPVSSSEDASETSSVDGIEWKTRARVSPEKAVGFVEHPVLSPASLPTVLRESERSFLKRDYKRSLFLVHCYFEEKNKVSTRSHSNPMSPNPQSTTQDSSPRVEENSIKMDSFKLVPPLRIPSNSRTRTFSFVVDFPFVQVPKATSISTNCSLLHEEIVAAASEAAAVDQLAAIGLQSWYELSKMEEQLSRKQRSANSSTRHRWSLLVEILDYYAYSCDRNVTFQKEEECQSRPKGRLSIEMLASLWISFWESNGCEIEAFVWTIQYLHLSMHSGATFQTKTAANKKILEELWLRCVCQQIPSYLNNNKELAQKILNIVTEKRKVPLQSSDFQDLFKEINVARKSKATGFARINPDAVNSVLVESLDSYLKNGEGDNESDHVSVSRNTVFEAHHWLVRQQDNQRSETARGNQNQVQEGQADCERLDKIALQDSSTKMPGIDYSSPPTTGFMDSGVPLAAIPFAQKAFDFLSKLGKRLPLRALVAARDIFQRMFLRILPGMENWSDSFGEILKARVLQLVCSTYLFSVSDPTQAGDAELSQQQKEERLQILRQHLQQALLSLVLFWAGWRGRKLLWKAGKGAVLASLAPLREILEALGPQE